MTSQLRIRELNSYREHDELRRAKELQSFLDLAIEELRPKRMAAPMSKLAELTAKIAESKKAREAKVDELFVRLATVNNKTESVLADAHGDLGSVEKDIADLEASLVGIGHNGAPHEG